MLVYRSVLYGISCLFFVRNFPLSFWTKLLFSVSSMEDKDGANFKSRSRSFLELNFHKMKPPKGSVVENSKLWNSESEVSVFFSLIPTSSFNHYMIFKKKSGIFTKNDRPSPPLPKTPNKFLPPSTTPAAHGAAKETDSASVATPPAEGLASAAAAFRDLRGQQGPQQVRVTDCPSWWKKSGDLEGCPICLGPPLRLRFWKLWFEMFAPFYSQYLTCRWIAKIQQKIQKCSMYACIYIYIYIYIYMKKKVWSEWKIHFYWSATRITANDAAIGKQPLTTVSGFNLFDTCFINLGIFPK